MHTWAAVKMATVVSAEVHFAQRLAGNEKKIRDKAVKRLKKWLEIKSTSTKGGLSHDDFLKIWKGLHYCMWMSDKPVIQEELASSISSLIHCLQENTRMVFSFIRVFFQTEAREWHGIDRWRVDKFMMLIRRFLNQSLVYLRNGGWSDDLLRQFTDIVTTEVVDVDGKQFVPEGVKYHIVDVYLEELSKVGAAELTEEQVSVFLKPFYSKLPLIKSQTFVHYLIKHMFDKIIEAEVERQQRENSSEEERMDEEDEEVVPKLKVNLEDLSDKIFEVAQAKSCVTRNRPVLYHLVTRLQKVAKGILPEERVPDSDDEDSIEDRDVYCAVRRLGKLDDHLIEQSGISERKKKKREKLRKLAAEQEKLERKKKRGKTKAEIYVVDQQTTENHTEPAEMETGAHVSELSENKHSKKKNKKQKKLLTNDGVIEVNDLTIGNEEFSEIKNSAIKAKKSKKFKKNNTESAVQSIVIGNGDEGAQHKKKRKSTDNVSGVEDTTEANSNNMLEEEIEIWIPNKKYKRKNSAPEASVSELESPIVRGSEKSKVKAAPSSFAQFEMGLKTPPAFVKKAFTKLRTPKTEPTKKTKKIMNPESGSYSAVKKKVSFNMKKNTSLDFDDSINFSPDLPFNPKVKPDQSILKSPVGQQHASQKETNLKKKLVKRLSASDFF